MEYPNRHSQRDLNDDEERVERCHRVAVAGKQHHQQRCRHEGGGSRHQHRQDEPGADLPLRRLPVPDPGERAESLAHHFEQTPPGAANEQTADPQDHHRERRQPAQAAENDQELRDVQHERGGIQQERIAKAITEVREHLSGEQTRIQ